MSNIRVIKVAEFSLSTPTTGSVTDDSVAPGANIAQSKIADLTTDLASKLAKAANLGDVASVPTSRTNLGLGTAATQNVGAFDPAGSAAAAAAASVRSGATGLAIDVGPPSGIDDTAAINAALAAGPSVFLRPGATYIALGQIINPWNADAKPLSINPSAHLWSVGSFADGTWAPGPRGACILDLRYAGRTDVGCVTTNGSLVVTDAAAVAGDVGKFVLGSGMHDRAVVVSVVPGVSFTMNQPATASATVSLTIAGPKIETRGRGVFKLSGLTLKSGGSDNVPFFRTTQTTVRIHDCAIYGNPANSGVTCAQDVFILGGTSESLDGSGNAAFQGYGSRIWDNYFSNIRRAMVGGMHCNSAKFGPSNVISTTCGSNLAEGACVEINPLAAPFSYNSIVEDNIFEVAFYPYPIKVDFCRQSHFRGNGFYDPTATTIAYIRFASVNNVGNLVVMGFGHVSKPHVSEAVPTLNMILDSNYGGQSFFHSPVLFGAGILTSPLDGVSTNPDIDFRLVGGLRAVFNTFGRAWRALGAGGNLEIDTGTGGSLFKVKAYELEHRDHNNVVRTRIGNGDGIEVTQAGKGVILKSPSGTRYRVTVTDAGVLTTTAL